MLFKIMTCFLILCFGHLNKSYGSAEVVIDEKNKIITLSSHLIYYGPAADSAVSELATNEILNTWNRDPISLHYKGSQYTLSFVITHETVSYDQLLEKKKTYKSPKYNFIGITAVSPVNSYYSYRGNSGVFVLTDNIGFSTTAAHEYGHGLGLSHPEIYDVHIGQPGIMQPSGSWVDREFQIDPQAKPGTKLGLIDTSKRIVTQKEIDTLEMLIGVIYFREGVGFLGKPDNLIFNL